MRSIIALTKFEQILPGQLMDQEASVQLITETHASQRGEDASRLAPLIKRYAVKPAQIAQRYFENTELSRTGADFLARAQFFATKGKDVVARFFDSERNPPDHVVHVTCTGYVSPSPVQHLVNDKGWAGKTGITHAYHMGCYASLPAVRIAEGLVSSRNKRVDIVHTEMCALHMDRTDHSPEQMVVQSLFADGHIKYSAVPAENAQHGYRVLAIHETLVPDSQMDMSWITASWGMKMTLSREVPTKIGGSLRNFMVNLANMAEVDLASLMKNSIFAIHPGGPKIIDAVKDILELSDEQIQASRQVLLERGNMSSATLPHVWDLLLSQNKMQPGQKVVSLAFGPGLTIFGAVFEAI